MAGDYTSDQTMGRLLFVHAGAIGDFVVTLPVLERLREIRPGSAVTILGRPHIASLALDGGLAEAVLDFDRSWVASLFSAKPDPLPGALECDVCVTFVRDPLLRHNLERCGAARVLEGTYRPEEAAGVHWADLAMRVLEPIGAARYPAILRLAPSAASVEASVEIAGREGVPILAVNPGTGSAAKRWPLERWIDLLEAVASPGCALVVLGGPGDEDLLASLREGLRWARASPVWAVNRPLPLVAGLLSRSAGYVGCDSGITHLAAAVGCPTLALFGPTDPDRFAPRGGHVRALREATSADAIRWVRERVAS
jgi:heptosyltransferase-3